MKISIVTGGDQEHLKFVASNAQDAAELVNFVRSKYVHDHPGKVFFERAETWEREDGSPHTEITLRFNLEEPHPVRGLDQASRDALDSTP